METDLTPENMKNVNDMSFEELSKEEEKLDEIVDDLISKFDKKWFTDKRKIENYEQDFKNYNILRRLACQPHYDRLTEVTRRRRFIMPYELSEIPSYGNVMSLDDFLENVKCGGFIDYDGHGKYIKDDQMTNISVYPSDLKNNRIRKEFTDIIWFNR